MTICYLRLLADIASERIHGINFHHFKLIFAGFFQIIAKPEQIHFTPTALLTSQNPPFHKYSSMPPSNLRTLEFLSQNYASYYPEIYLVELNLYRAVAKNDYMYMLFL
ncbi:hypothetical protein RF11_14897 [Thelohanellus kitauei]|uniref:Uncharacterized protein n=1 Tax=Thelohanellus kitauei TaxID=669202 RepID=A0A0C2MFK0_THEKT|nr:hypothetical protein RF11_14897 [Thelohanellus kitauei]